MPHGPLPLTPLGRQLREVLAQFSHSHTRRRARADSAHRNLFHIHATINSQAASAVAPRQEEKEGSIEREGAKVTNKRFHRLSARAVRRGFRVDHVGAALKDTGKADLVYTPKQKNDAKLDPSYESVRTRNAYHATRIRQRYASVSKPLRILRSVSLQSILASYISWQDSQADSLAADWHSTFALSPLESSFLHKEGYGLEDVTAWAGIVTEKDSFAAAQKLGERTRTLGAFSTPLFICTSVLHRPYIAPKALRALLNTVIDTFDHRSQQLSDPGLDNEPRFIAAIRLVRHARDVWPQALPMIAEFVLKPLHTKSLTKDQIPTVTHSLNSLMNLISLSTAERPFKDNHFQEAAIVPILSYMSEHQPPLQINRQGYRAVIRMQLSQRKTDKEQQWAELKTPSWPPWKVDRTAMDSAVTADSHGRSRAGETLWRMGEAGYRALNWEQVARVYGGWDVDETPTIQKRTRHDRTVVLPRSLLRIGRSYSRNDPWAARIDCTRTVQEAWACYLAWEDLQFPPNQHVYQAIVSKLRQEQRRSSVGKRRDGERAAWPLYPGDGRETAPLPSSTHLHTYTPTQPPSVDEFYHRIRSKGIFFENHCLALFVRHAQNLPTGLHYLSGHIPQYPDIQGLLTLDRSHDLSKLPAPIYAAALALFARFGYISPSKTGLDDVKLTSDSSKPLLKGQVLDTRVGVVRAIELLRLRPEPHPPFWNTVYQGLTRERNLECMAAAFITRLHEGQQDCDLTSPEHRRYDGAMNAYHLWRRVLAIQHEKYIDLDSTGFQAQCLATENMALAVWSILAETEALKGKETEAGSRDEGKPKYLSRLVRSARRNFIPRDETTTPKAAVSLKREFATLTGCRYDEKSGNLIPLPSISSDRGRLLTIPSPALLHAYVRALGFLADYEGLTNLVWWMREYRGQLKQRQDLDRRGEDMTRKVVTALRVGLERCWLTSEMMESARTNDELALDGGQRRTAKYLSRLRSPAANGVVDEVRGIVEGVEEWEGWPSDEEVETYCSHERFGRWKY